MSKTQPRILFLSKNINDNVGYTYWKGIAERCQERGVALRSVSGNLIGKGPQAFVYDLVDAEHCDAVIGWAATDEGVAVPYFRRFGSKPTLILTSVFRGLKSFLIDNKPGVEAAVEHLITVHGRKRIAFLQGTANFPYFDQRREAWEATLKRHGLYDPALCSPNGPTEPSVARSHMELLTGERRLTIGSGIDAVVCCNDLMAFAVIEWAVGRGFEVPKDLAVVGFNHSVEAQMNHPTLASIAMPFTEQGRLAVDLVLADLTGSPPPDTRTMVSEFKPAQSCGCQTRLVDDVAPQLVTGTSKKGRKSGHGPEANLSFADSAQVIASSRRAVIEEMVQRASDTLQRPADRAMAEGMLDLIQDAIAHADSATFCHRIVKLMEPTARGDGDFEPWHALVSMARTSLLGLLKSEHPRDFLGGVMQQARLLVAEAERHYQTRRIREVNARADAFRQAGNRILASEDQETFQKTLAEWCNKFQVPRAAVLTLGPSNVLTPLVWFDAQGKTSPPTPGFLDQVLPMEVQPGRPWHSQIVLPLTVGNQRLGVVVFGEAPVDSGLYVNIADQLATAVRSRVLFEAQAKSAEALGRTFATMEQQTALVSGQTETITKNIQGISAAMEQVAANIRGIVDTVAHISGVSSTAVQASQRTQTQMKELEAKGVAIGSIVAIIDDIAEQTNVLAINAAIQSSHAGPYGKAFSVVAREIKTLSQRTAVSTKEIIQTVEDIRTTTETAVTTLSGLAQIVQDIDRLAREINAAIDQQAKATNEVSTILADVAQGSASIAQAMEDLAALGKRGG